MPEDPETTEQDSSSNISQHRFTYEYDDVGRMIALTKPLSNSKKYYTNYCSDIRGWWHSVIRTYGKPSCCATFLILPSDKEAMRYLNEYGVETHLISGEDCLVIIITENSFIQHFNLAETVWTSQESRKATVEAYSANGYSLRFAELFEVNLTEFPCVILFKDIRATEHVIVPLKDMTAEEIAKRMRLIFAVIQSAISDGKDPLNAIIMHQRFESIRKKGREVSGSLSKIAEKTLEKVMEAIIDATVK